MPETEVATRQDGLRAGLRRRHMTMLAIGGAVGAGLFVGSGAVINAAGPAAVLSYAAAGLLVLLVLRALGEMVVARPVAGSLAEYARMALGPWAGFTIGWLYWYLYVVLVGAEAVAGAAILAEWTGLPPWLLAAGLLMVMTAVNLVSVRSFGEFEFWFASIKVAAIVVFLVLGALAVLGLWPDARRPGHAHRPGRARPQRRHLDLLRDRGGDVRLRRHRDRHHRRRREPRAGPRGGPRHRERAVAGRAVLRPGCCSCRTSAPSSSPRPPASPWPPRSTRCAAASGSTRR
ncbi:hypothetical protein GCM10010191_62090 [Actinomadura vinacea]|uniref:Amino acid permease/ SLC12A domain-containing protein n=1 Tax=Actinomadura vinacea TaxID=115336 RepID=A0ABN3JUZ7_9ACTN